MGCIPRIQFHPICNTLVLMTISRCFLSCISTNNNSSDLDSLVYKNCANQSYKGSITSYSQTLSSILQELSSQSSHSKFFRTNKVNDTLGIEALFQCKGDLSNDECHNCVKRLADTPSTHCKQPSLAGRIHLSGCYFRFELDEFAAVYQETTKQDVLHQTCGENTALAGGFQEVRDAALDELENGIMGSGNGFYQGDYEYVHVVGQCDAGLGACDCDQCVSAALQIVKEECGSSDSGQVYLDGCFVGYNYNPDGIPGSSSTEQGTARNSNGRTAAIVAGGIAALFVGYMFFRFIKSGGNDI